MPEFNLHSLFDNSIGKPSFLANISLSPDKREILRGSRTTVRARIRRDVNRALQQLVGGENQSPLSPRFFTQGSYAYKTLNSPYRPPTQQADLDDGVYFPFSYVESMPPKIMSELLWRAVDSVLAVIAKEMRWRLITSNANCSRLVIAEDMHLDVPLYKRRAINRRRLVAASNERRLDGEQRVGLGRI